jgi:hypothetical protein
MRKTNKVWLTAIAMIAGTIVSASAGAQTMYRCGNSYQAYPCETGQGKAIGSVGREQSAYTPVSNAECAQRGTESLKIVWAREAGLIREKALAEVDGKPLSSAQKADARKLIADVYNKRGSAPEVRAAIEADCVVEKEKEAQAAMYRSANSADQKQAAPYSNPQGSNDANARATDPNRKELASSNAAAKRMRCEKLNRQLEDVHRSQRAGADVQEMEKLNQERRDIQRSQIDTGC